MEKLNKFSGYIIHINFVISNCLYDSINYNSKKQPILYLV